MTHDCIPHQVLAALERSLIATDDCLPHQVLEALEGVGMGAAAAAWPALRRRLARGTLSAADDLLMTS